jgi:hypothetical protein
MILNTKTRQVKAETGVSSTVGINAIAGYIRTIFQQCRKTAAKAIKRSGREIRPLLVERVLALGVRNSGG